MAVPNLPQSFLDSAKEAFDHLITGWGKPCTLVYPSLQEECNNCYFDYTTGTSSGHYKTGGPISFAEGSQCPLCHGHGFRQTEQKEVVTLRLIFDPKETKLPNYSQYAGNSVLPLLLPGGLLETRGFTTDIPKIYRAVELIAQNALDGYKHCRYQKIGEPQDLFHIIQGRYFSCFWERRG